MPSPLEDVFVEESSPNWTTSVKTLSNSVCQTVGNFKEKIITKCQNIPINLKKSVTCVFVLILACQVSNVYLTPKNNFPNVNFPQEEPTKIHLECKVVNDGYECTGNKEIFENHKIMFKNHEGVMTKIEEIKEEFKCKKGKNGQFCYKTFKNNENEEKVMVKFNKKKNKILKGKKMN